MPRLQKIKIIPPPPECESHRCAPGPVELFVIDVALPLEQVLEQLPQVVVVGHLEEVEPADVAQVGGHFFCGARESPRQMGKRTNTGRRQTVASYLPEPEMNAVVNIEHTPAELRDVFSPELDVEKFGVKSEPFRKRADAVQATGGGTSHAHRKGAGFLNYLSRGHALG